MTNILVDYRRIEQLGVADFLDILKRSGLAERRPIHDIDRIRRMIDGSNLIVGAFDQTNEKLLGISRSLTDFSYCCYISDLAVDRDYQELGIGRSLLQATRDHAGPEAMCLLVSSPTAQAFYESIGMPRTDRAFLYARAR